MAQERFVTPEKQLLKLIEGSAIKGVGPADAQALKYHSFGFFSLGAWRGRISYFKAKVNKWSKGEETFHLEVAVINHLLLVACAGLVVYFLVYSYVAYSNFKRIQAVGLFPSVSAASARGGSEMPSLQKPSSYYQEKVTQRDIFKMGSKKPEIEIKEPTSKTLELAQNLKLVGISWSDDPDAMVEDKKLSRTFFIKKGHMVGEAKVKAIFKDKVVLELDGEEFELR